jgi:hypothetical protein
VAAAECEFVIVMCRACSRLTIESEVDLAPKPPGLIRLSRLLAPGRTFEGGAIYGKENRLKPPRPERTRSRKADRCNQTSHFTDLPPIAQISNQLS